MSAGGASKTGDVESKIVICCVTLILFPQSTQLQERIIIAGQAPDIGPSNPSAVPVLPQLSDQLRFPELGISVMHSIVISAGGVCAWSA